MQAITLEAILRVVFGVADGPRLERLRGVLATVLTETASPRSQLIALATRRFRGGNAFARFEGQLQEVDDLLYAEIAEHRTRPDLAEREDILSMLMLAEFEDGGQMSDKELRDQLMTLLLAGHETTATALAWTFDLLLRHPEPLRKLRDSLAAGEDDYLRATISESLRLRPVLPLAGRRLAKELAVDGLTLPAGTDVAPAIWLTHTRPDLYPEPFAFRPERFLERGPRHLRLDPLRRRHPPLHRRLLRRVRDADRPARGADPLRPAQGQPAAGEDRPPQHHPLAQGRHPGRGHGAASGARARARRCLAPVPVQKIHFQRVTRETFCLSASAIMEAMRQSWSDDRLDDLNQRVDAGFTRVDERFAQMDARFAQIEERMQAGFNRSDERLEAGLDQSG